MLVQDLITELQKLPPDAVICAWSGRLEDGDYTPAWKLDPLRPAEVRLEAGEVAATNYVTLIA